MISRCKAVEKLVLGHCRKVRNIAIRAPSLQVLEISAYRPVCVAVKKAPCLNSVKLSLSYGCAELSWSFHDNEGTDLESSDLDKMERLFDFEELAKREHEQSDEVKNIITFLSGLGCAKELRLYLTSKYAKVLSRSKASLPTSLPKKCYLRGLLLLDYHIEALAIVLSCLLNSSPNLKDLEIFDPPSSCRAIPIKEEFWVKQIKAECVEQHLSSVTFFYMGRTSFEGCLGLPKFLVMNGRVLKRMSIRYSNWELKKQPAVELERIQKELLLWPRASPHVLLELSPGPRTPSI